MCFGDGVRAIGDANDDGDVAGACVRSMPAGIYSDPSHLWDCGRGICGVPSGLGVADPLPCVAGPMNLVIARRTPFADDKPCALAPRPSTRPRLPSSWGPGKQRRPGDVARLTGRTRRNDASGPGFCRRVVAADHHEGESQQHSDEQRHTSAAASHELQCVTPVRICSSVSITARSPVARRC